MSSDVVYSAVRAWFDANWTATPVAWENETFEPPVLTAYPAAPAAWLEVELIGNSYDQMSIGAGGGAAERWAEGGAVLIFGLVQAGAGSLVIRAHLTRLAEQLRGLELPGGIRFRSMAIGDGGPGDDDGNFWQLTLRADWLRG
jgi:hypothetical protein